MRACGSERGARGEAVAQVRASISGPEPPRVIGVQASRSTTASDGLHLAVEQGQKLLSVVITAGQRGDSPQFEPVLEAIKIPRPGLGRPRKRPDRSARGQGVRLP